MEEKEKQELKEQFNLTDNELKIIEEGIKKRRQIKKPKMLELDTVERIAFIGLQFSFIAIVVIFIWVLIKIL